jgi:hypothetical protein
VARGSPQQVNWRWPCHHTELTEFERLAGPSASRFAAPATEFGLTPRILHRAERRQCLRRTRLALLSPRAWRRPSAEKRRHLLAQHQDVGVVLIYLAVPVLPVMELAGAQTNPGQESLCG